MRPEDIKAGDTLIRKRNAGANYGVGPGDTVVVHTVCDGGFRDKHGGWHDAYYYNPVPTAVGAKHDTGKPLATALFRGCAKALSSVLAVLTFGAAKYKEDSWRTVPDAKKRYEGALGRHWLAFCSGEEYDAETGLPHLAHMATNAMFLLELRAESGEITNLTKFNSPEVK